VLTRVIGFDWDLNDITDTQTQIITIMRVISCYQFYYRWNFLQALRVQTNLRIKNYRATMEIYKTTANIFKSASEIYQNIEDKSTSDEI
jgi:hypothetical protein